MPGQITAVFALGLAVKDLVRIAAPEAHSNALTALGQTHRKGCAPGAGPEHPNRNAGGAGRCTHCGLLRENDAGLGAIALLGCSRKPGHLLLEEGLPIDLR